MENNYQVQPASNTVNKQFAKVLGRFSLEQLSQLRDLLQNDPKGANDTHWKIKKVAKDVWQCDAPGGYRIAYTVIDKPSKLTIILFAGNHDDAAVFLRSKK